MSGENDEDEEDDDDEEDEDVGDFDESSGQNFDFNELEAPSSTNNSALDNLSLNSLTITSYNRKLQVQPSATSGASSNEDCISDTSTICAESTSIEHLNWKYAQKVKHNTSL